MNRVFPTTLFPEKAPAWFRELRIIGKKVNRYKLEELLIYQKLLKLKQFLRLPKEHVDQVCLSFSYFFYLFPFNFIDAEERNASLDKNIKN